jgi:hypothetical protein
MAPGEQPSNHQRAERVAAKVARAQQTLAAEVTALESREDWQRYLAFQARFDAYSPNNVTLTVAQHRSAHAEGRIASREPTYVAGFGIWRALGRSVGKGHHGYAVLAPCRYHRRVAVGRDRSTRRLSPGDSPGEGETVDRRSELGGFRVEYVFHASQTSGVAVSEVPEPVRPALLEGKAPPRLGAVGAGDDRGSRLPGRHRGERGRDRRAQRSDGPSREDRGRPR